MMRCFFFSFKRAYLNAGLVQMCGVCVALLLKMCAYR